MNELEKQIEENNKEIEELKETIKTNFNKDIDDINTYEVDSNNLESIIESQRKDIARLNTIVDIESQNAAIQIEKKIEELKKDETDKVFSEFYRNGVIVVNGVDVSVDKFFVKQTESDHGVIYNFICTDKRIDKSIFKTINDKDFKVKNIYVFKDSKTFYNIYLDKSLFIDNKIILNDEQQLNKFMEYVKHWMPEKHKMVAETMIN